MREVRISPFKVKSAIRSANCILVLSLIATSPWAVPLPQDEWLSWESKLCRLNIEKLIRRDTRIRGSKTHIDLVVEPLVPTYLKSAVRLQQLQLEKSEDDARREFDAAAAKLKTLGAGLVIFQVSPYRITNGQTPDEETRQADAFVELVEEQISLSSIRGKQEEALEPSLLKRASPSSFVIGFSIPPSWADGADQIRLTLVARDTLRQEIGYFRASYEAESLELN